MIMPHEKDINDVGRKKALNISIKSKYLTYSSLQRLKDKYRDEHKS